jgi:hypothetical protein
MKMTPSSRFYDKTYAGMQLTMVMNMWNADTSANFLFSGVPGGSNPDLGATEALIKFNELQQTMHPGWSTGFGGNGAQLKLRGMYRVEIDKAAHNDVSVWSATDAEREANALKTLKITSKVNNMNHEHDLASGNEAVMGIEVTRPWIESGDVFTATYNPNANNFDELLGLGS